LWVIEEGSAFEGDVKEDSWRLSSSRKTADKQKQPDSQALLKSASTIPQTNENPPKKIR
jgi:hypothetical protein